MLSFSQKSSTEMLITGDACYWGSTVERVELANMPVDKGDTFADDAGAFAAVGGPNGDLARRLVQRLRRGVPKHAVAAEAAREAGAALGSTAAAVAFVEAALVSAAVREHEGAGGRADAGDDGGSVWGGGGDDGKALDALFSALVARSAALYRISPRHSPSCHPRRREWGLPYPVPLPGH